MAFSEDQLTSYLEDIDIPVLTATYRNGLDRPITVEEILKAIKTLQSGKTSGPDGIPVELYKQYADVIAVRFLAMMVKSAELETLPKSMGEAVIVVILKPEKDPSLCSSYWPISLLNVDVKIIAKNLRQPTEHSYNSPCPPQPNGIHAGQGHRYHHQETLYPHCQSRPGRRGAGSLSGRGEGF